MRPPVGVQGPAPKHMVELLNHMLLLAPCKADHASPMDWSKGRQIGPATLRANGHIRLTKKGVTLNMQNDPARLLTDARAPFVDKSRFDRGCRKLLSQKGSTLRLGSK